LPPADLCSESMPEGGMFVKIWPDNAWIERQW
jgi:hypothetical protein